MSTNDSNPMLIDNSMFNLTLNLPKLDQSLCSFCHSYQFPSNYPFQSHDRWHLKKHITYIQKIFTKIFQKRNAHITNSHVYDIELVYQLFFPPQMKRIFSWMTNWKMFMGRVGALILLKFDPTNILNLYLCDVSLKGPSLNPTIAFSNS